jgi:hypothetical protein
MRPNSVPVLMFYFAFVWDGGAMACLREYRDQKAVAALEHRHLGADELRTAMVAVRNKSISVFDDVRQTAETSAIQIAQFYWFRCPTCNFDWPTWLKPSIIFISLSFVTDECPNCRRKHIPAYKMEADY